MNLFTARLCRVGLLVLLSLVVGAAIRADDTAAKDPIPLGSRRELFVDSFLIDKLTNTTKGAFDSSACTPEVSRLPFKYSSHPPKPPGERTSGEENSPRAL